MKYSVGRESRTGRSVTLGKREGKTSVNVNSSSARTSSVSKETLKSAKSAANTSYREVTATNNS